MTINNKQMFVYLYEFKANTPEMKHNKTSSHFNMGYYLELNFQKTIGGGGGGGSKQSQSSISC